MSSAPRVQTIPPAERSDNADVELLALAGNRADCPELSEIAVHHELARRRYGVRLADEADQYGYA